MSALGPCQLCLKELSRIVGDHLIEDDLLDAAVGSGFCEMLGEKFVELDLLFGVGNDDVLGAGAMGSRVGGRTGFAFGCTGAGAVGVLRVGLIGGLHALSSLQIIQNVQENSAAITMRQAARIVVCGGLNRPHIRCWRM